ncbi:hypothetical protein [Thiobacter aerophilum]|uniref:Uncharacterized protein n=1 Tax=Thiobacter aerophilum TaxID=3121275 RepID=A0ABV0EFA0_9BURK
MPHHEAGIASIAGFIELAQPAVYVTDRLPVTGHGQVALTQRGPCPGDFQVQLTLALEPLRLDARQGLALG